VVANSPTLSVTSARDSNLSTGISIRRSDATHTLAAGNMQDSNTFGVILTEVSPWNNLVILATSSNQANANALKLSAIHGSTAPTAATFRLQGNKSNGSGGYTTIANAEPVISYGNFASSLMDQLGSGAMGIRNSAPTSTTTLTVRGQGTSTGISFRTEDSGGAARFTVQDRGNIFTNERSDMASSVHSFVFNSTKDEYWRPTIAFKNSTFNSAIAGWLGGTDVLGYFGTSGSVASTGGLGLFGACAPTASLYAWQMQGFHGSTAPTEAVIRIVGTKYSGSGSGANLLAALADSEKILSVINSGTVGGTNVRMVILGSGAMGLRNTAPTSSTSLTVRGHGTTTGISLLVENSSGTARFTVQDDGAYAFAGGTVGAAQTGYTTPTNLTTDRTFDANATTIDELADVLGTLIEDLKTKGIIAA
jgi:hypothetical protein